MDTITKREEASKVLVFAKPIPTFPSRRKLYWGIVRSHLKFFALGLLTAVGIATLNLDSDSPWTYLVLVPFFFFAWTIAGSFIQIVDAKEKADNREATDLRYYFEDFVMPPAAAYLDTLDKPSYLVREGNYSSRDDLEFALGHAYQLFTFQRETFTYGWNHRIYKDDGTGKFVDTNTFLAVTLTFLTANSMRVDTFVHDEVRN